MSPAPDTCAAPYPRVVHAEARLAKLREASDLTLAVMRVTARQVIEAAEPPPAPQEPETVGSVDALAPAPPRPASPGVDPVERLAKLNRMLRMAIALEARLEDALTAYLAGETVKPARADAEADEDVDADVDEEGDEPRNPAAFVHAGRRGVVRQLLVDVADHEIPDAEDYDLVIEALDERLMFDDAYDDLEDAPLRRIVESLCDDLQLKPDWGQWAGDGWRPRPPLSRRRCSRFAQPSRKPILDDPDDPDWPPRE